MHPDKGGDSEFQSTHPYRVWRRAKPQQMPTPAFQSTHPYRVWLETLPCRRSHTMFQSTHPYRVWPTLRRLKAELGLFQSTHPYRVWLARPVSRWKTWRFQSTHPYRVWLHYQTFKFRKSCFNPHTHTGCDKKRKNPDNVYIVSIHTPIQGVTRNWNHIKYLTRFQSTHPYRVWPSPPSFFSEPPSFNPHTHTGCD